MPDKIGKYVVVREVGRGSTGIVYLSHDAYYGRDGAIDVKPGASTFGTFNSKAAAKKHEKAVQYFKHH